MTLILHAYESKAPNLGDISYVTEVQFFKTTELNLEFDIDQTMKLS